jgi:steroid delta-isomerase-like uncharacterized protein
MSSESENQNIQLAEQQIAALNARDIDRYLQRIDDSFVGEAELPPSPIHGREGVRQALGIALTAFPDLRIEVEQILASGDHVVVRSHLTGTHKGNFRGIAPTNKVVSWRSCNVVEIQNGKAIRGRVYSDNASLLQQLGVLSLPKAAVAG